MIQLIAFLFLTSIAHADVVPPDDTDSSSDDSGCSHVDPALALPAALAGIALLSTRRRR